MCQQAMLTRAIDGCTLRGIAVMTIATLLTILTVLTMCTVFSLVPRVVL